MTDNNNGNEMPINNSSSSKFLYLVLKLSKNLVLFLAKVATSVGLFSLSTVLGSIATGVVMPIALATGLALGTAYTVERAMSAIFSPNITETRSVSFIGSFPADKLFTSYAIIPVIYLNFKNTQNGEKITGEPDFAYQTGIPDNLKPTGYCKMKYQVAFGYEQVQEKMSNLEYVRAVCAGNFDALPSPSIMSKLPLEMADGEGTYSQTDCENIDSIKATNGNLLIDNYIDGVLAIQTETLESVIDKSKKALGSFIKINCSMQNI